MKSFIQVFSNSNIAINANLYKIEVRNRLSIFLFKHTEKNLFENFTFFIRKFIIFIVVLGHARNV